MHRWECHESVGDGAPRRQLGNASKTRDGVLWKAVFDMIQNKTAAVNWPYPHNSVGTLCNKTTEGWDKQVTNIAKDDGQGRPLGMVQ
jgi:hypothetical protein